MICYFHMLAGCSGDTHPSQSRKWPNNNHRLGQNISIGNGMWWFLSNHEWCLRRIKYRVPETNKRKIFATKCCITKLRWISCRPVILKIVAIEITCIDFGSDFGNLKYRHRRISSYTPWISTIGGGSYSKKLLEPFSVDCDRTRRDKHAYIGHSTG